MTGATVASTQHLRELIEEATVDCYDEEEQATGLFTMIEEKLALPLKTTVLGITADVVSVDMAGDGGWLLSAKREGIGRGSPWPTSPCRRRRRPARSGSQPTGCGCTVGV